MWFRNARFLWNLWGIKYNLSDTYGMKISSLEALFTEKWGFENYGRRNDRNQITDNQQLFLRESIFRFLFREFNMERFKPKKISKGRYLINLDPSSIQVQTVELFDRRPNCSNALIIHPSMQPWSDCVILGEIKWLFSCE